MNWDDLRFFLALAMEETAQAADREVFGLDAQLSGTLKLTASADVFTSLVAPRLHLFTDLYPGIDLEMLASTGLSDLASRQADIALRSTARVRVCRDFLVEIIEQQRDLIEGLTSRYH